MKDGNWPQYRRAGDVTALMIGDGAITINPDGTVTLPIADAGYGPLTLPWKTFFTLPKTGDYVVVFENGRMGVLSGEAFGKEYVKV